MSEYIAAVEAERVVLGTAVAFPTRWQRPLLEAHVERDFVGGGHGAIFAAIATARRCDPVSLHTHMAGDSPGLDAISALARAADPVAWHDLSRAVADRSARRSHLEALQDASGRIASGDDLAAVSQALFAALGRASSRSESLTHVKDIVPAVLKDIASRAASPGAAVGIGTGVKAIDDVTGGFRPGQLIVLAGLTGGGKTSLAMQATDQAEASFCVNMEMTNSELVERKLCHASRQDSELVRQGAISLEGMERLRRSAATVSARDVYLEDDIYTLTDICAKARAWRSKHQSARGLIVVDFLQLMRLVTDKSRETRASQLGAAAQGLKSLAKSLGVPVILVSQLNREASKPDVKPTLWHLKESGDIEQAADVILITYQSAGNPDDDSYEVTTDIAKNRGGRRGLVKSWFVGPNYRFQDLENTP